MLVFTTTGVGDDVGVGDGVGADEFELFTFGVAEGEESGVALPIVTVEVVAGDVPVVGSLVGDVGSAVGTIVGDVGVVVGVEVGGDVGVEVGERVGERVGEGLGFFLSD